MPSNTALCMRVFARTLLMMPVAPIAIVLMLTFIGAPLGLALCHVIGKFVTKPIMDDPRFKIGKKPFEGTDLEGYDDYGMVGEW